MKKQLIGVGILLSFISGWASAEDSPKEACQNAAELYADNDVTGALEEAKWCVTLLEQEKQQSVNRVFPDTLMGFQGAEIEHQSAMGFSSTVRDYNQGDQTITVTLSGGSAMGGAMNAFAALAQYGGGTKTRIQKRSATINNSDGQVQVMVSLKSGGLLMFEAYDITQTKVVDFAKAFPVEKLDDSQQ